MIDSQECKPRLGVAARRKLKILLTRTFVMTDTLLKLPVVVYYTLYVLDISIRHNELIHAWYEYYTYRWIRAVL